MGSFFKPPTIDQPPANRPLRTANIKRAFTFLKGQRAIVTHLVLRESSVSMDGSDHLPSIKWSVCMSHKNKKEKQKPPRHIVMLRNTLTSGWNLTNV